MRPAAFATLGGPPRAGVAPLVRNGLRNLAAGALLFALARVTPIAVATPLMMIALPLMLHFGVFHLLAAFWRAHGAATDRLMRDPLRATTLADFWSGRWNAGFSEMTALLVYRPLRRRRGETAALMASFLVSGLLHELAISVPVGAGYGLPTLYFLLHGALTATEKRQLLGAPSRVRTLALLAIPLPILFHPWFVRGIIQPLL
ncbi:MAG TPA: membrane bound O-acyl transferase family-domain-containing protein, partial [Thermoanaerobaculia bacterium]|nr:membrane bound O-acyl transferase family-domain-containing protein [Thermoanaerobaculia bacterium]